MGTAMRRMVIVDAEEQGLPRTQLFNPVLSVLGADSILMEESCMSVPGLVGVVKRAARVAVDYLDETGQTRRLEASGWSSGLLQHELDHLDGVLLVDRVPREHLAFVEPYYEHVRPKYESKLAQDGTVSFL